MNKFQYFLGVLFLSTFVYAQESRDINLRPQKVFSGAVEVRDKQGWGGEVWSKRPMVAGSVTMTPSGLPVNVEGFVWSGYSFGEDYVELDFGGTVSKDVLGLEAGVQGAMYTLKIGGDEAPTYDISGLVRYAPSEKLGFSVTKDFRGWEYGSLSSSVNVDLGSYIDNLRMKVRTSVDNSFNYGFNMRLEHILFFKTGPGELYMNVFSMRSFEHGGHDVIFKLGYKL